MGVHNEVQEATNRLLDYIEREKYAGYDPYDALTSPLFNLPLLRKNHLLRFYAQQAVKRSPINLRRLMGVRKRINPVTLGLVIQSYAQIDKRTQQREYRMKAQMAIRQLEEYIPKGFHGSCWGYDFPWEARYASIPAFQPTVVATGIISHGLFEAWTVYKDDKAGELLSGAAEFVSSDLNRKVDKDGNICFSYSPFDHEAVFNASMKGARILAEAYALTGNKEFAHLAGKAVRYVMKHQRTDGSWEYSERKTGTWVDNYHTGYILDCLDSYMRCTGDYSHESGVKKGFEFYLRNFIRDDGRPELYAGKTGPVDCTAGAQTLLTLTRFGEKAKAAKVALWMCRYMQDPEGYFYYRREGRKTRKTSFMRWSNAWMLAGLTGLLCAEGQKTEVA